MRIKSSLSCAILASIVFTTQTNAATFQGIGDLYQSPHGNTGLSTITALSADGKTFAGLDGTFSSSNFYYTEYTEAFIHHPDQTVTPLGFLDDNNPISFATGISANGQVVIGESKLNGKKTAFRWSADQGMTTIISDFESTTRDISSAGNFIAGSIFIDNIARPFRWSPQDGTTLLQTPSGSLFNGTAEAMSNDGSIIIGIHRSDNEQAFRWTADQGMQILENLNPTNPNTQAKDISGNGQYIVGSSTSNAVRWSPDGSIQIIDSLENAHNSFALATSYDGSTVVGGAYLTDSSMNASGFIWQENIGTQSIASFLTNIGLTSEIQDWELQIIWDISDDGLTIAGEGINPDGNYEAWIATIPEPTSLILLSLTTLPLLTRRKHENS
ncbi:hypothetical protein JD969_01105 [Planctomycetota bacterium]|nr:hypothetical protein JD969_01105 [Planctomycetota bacterium]